MRLFVALRPPPQAVQELRHDLTVGKCGHPSPHSLAGYRGPSWPATEVELVRSDLGRTVVHTVLERYPPA